MCDAARVLTSPCSRPDAAPMDRYWETSTVRCAPCVNSYEAENAGPWYAPRLADLLCRTDCLPMATLNVPPPDVLTRRTTLRTASTAAVFTQRSRLFATRQRVPCLLFPTSANCCLAAALPTTRLAHWRQKLHTRRLSWLDRGAEICQLVLVNTK